MVLVVAILGVGASGFVVGRRSDEVGMDAPIVSVAQPAKKVKM